MLDVFVGIIILIFLGLFLLMSLPVWRSDDYKTAELDTQPPRPQSE